MATAASTMTNAVSTSVRSPREVCDALDRWMTSVDHASWDPYDALTSPVLAPLSAWPWAARVALQVVKRSPVNLRPALGIRQRVLTQTLSDLVSAWALTYRLDGDETALGRARDFAARLRARARRGRAGTCWSMDLPYVSRFTSAAPTTPNLFQTVNAARAFLDLHASTHDDRDLQPAVLALEWLREDLGPLESTPAQVIWRYYPGQSAAVYNVNALVGALLCRVANILGRDELADLARRTLAFVIGAQAADGSWTYARGPRGAWIDGFHSGYVLEALLEAERHVENVAASAALERGMRFYCARLLEPSGLPRYTDTNLYPIDVQNCAEAVQLLSKLGARDGSMLQRARRAYEETARHLLVWRSSGSTTHAWFRMQRGRYVRNDLATIRWGAAPMRLALAHLLFAETQNITKARSSLPQRE